MSYSDDDLRNAVNAVFDAYDKDKSGTLEANEITQLINDALKHMGQGRQVTQQEVNQFIAAVDKNNDGKVAKPELFEIFKRVISNKWAWSFLYKTSLISFSAIQFINMPRDTVSAKGSKLRLP